MQLLRLLGLLVLLGLLQLLGVLLLLLLHCKRSKRKPDAACSTTTSWERSKGVVKGTSQSAGPTH